MVIPNVELRLCPLCKREVSLIAHGVDKWGIGCDCGFLYTMCPEMLPWWEHAKERMETFIHKIRPPQTLEVLVANWNYKPRSIGSDFNNIKRCPRCDGGTETDLGDRRIRELKRTNISWKPLVKHIWCCNCGASLSFGKNTKTDIITQWNTRKAQGKRIVVRSIKDTFGRDVRVGDCVIYARGGWLSLYKGVVTKVGETRVSVGTDHSINVFAKVCSQCGGENAN